MTQTQSIFIVVGYIVTLVSGGLMGAGLNRYFHLKDRRENEEKEKKPDILTLEKIQDEQEFVSIGDGKHYVKKAYKRFHLINSSSKNIDKCTIIFEFDKYSVIANCNALTPKGTYQCLLKEKENGKYVFAIKEFNKLNKIEFIFEQDIQEMIEDGIGFGNFWDVFLTDCTGFEIEKIASTQWTIDGRINPK
jgi:hypothetical protein